MRKLRLILVTFIAILSLAVASEAAETVKYTYDGKGRLVKIERTGTVNNGVITTYTHDKADNRTNIKVVGSSR